MSLQELLQKTASKDHFSTGTYLFEEGDPADRLYLITEGQVAVVKNAGTESALVLAYRGEGSLLGEVSLLIDAPRSAASMAIEAVTTLSISKDRAWHLIDTDPDFRRLIIGTLINNLLAADDSRVSTAAAEREMFSRLSELSTKNEELAELMQLRQETINFIVHDLRNPLSLISMALTMIENDPEYPPEADSRRFLSMALGGARRMNNLVASLLDVQRLEQGQTLLSIKRVKMPKIVDKAVEQSQPLAWASKLEITVTHQASQSPRILADPERIDRVMANLLDNAIKHTPPDGQIRVSTDHKEGEILVAVEDEGPGIPQDQRKRIFDRFAQVSGKEGKRRGFGLGLTYCRTAIEAHGGRIWIEDAEQGSGSRFVFALPTIPAATAD